MIEKPNNEAEPILQALMDAAVDAIIIADDKGCIQVFSRSAEKLLGYKQAEIVGENLRIIMPPPYREAHDGYIEKYQTTRKPAIIGIGRLVDAQRKDGSILPIELSVGEAVSSDGGIRYVGIIRDVSDRIAAEKDRANLLKKHQAILASIPDLLVEVDQDRQITWANEHALDFFGHLLMGADCRDIFSGDNQAQQKFESLVSSKSNGVYSNSFESWHSNIKGERRLLVWNWGTMKNDNGCTSGVIATARDKTEDYQAEIGLKQAESEAREHRDKLAHVSRLSLLGEMAAGIAHEVNQPLTAISTYAQASRRLLSLPDTQPQVISDTLQKISDQAQRAGDIILRMRKFVKYKSSMLEQVDVNELISEVLGLMESDITSNYIELRHELFDERVFVSVDPVQIQQVVLNLIRNAIESIDLNSHDKNSTNLSARNISIETKYIPPRDIEVSVADSGVGVYDDDIGQLFHPFFTTKSTGLGMGLSICRSIISAHKGELNFRPNPDGGAIFYFTLPVALADSEDDNA